jgi:predicted transcriptional regulator
MLNVHTISQLGRRERQIVEAIYQLGKATVAEVRAALPDPPSYSAVRGMLNLLEEKGHVRHRRNGMRYVYTPAIPVPKARASALRHLISTFFGGSPLAAAAALLEMPEAKLSAKEREELAARIARAKKEGR